MAAEPVFGPEARRLSSRATTFYRALPWIVAGSVGLLALFTRAAPKPHPLLLAALALFAFVILFATLGRLCDLWVNGSELIAQRGRRAVRVSASEVAGAGGSRFTNPEIVWLDLRRPGEFGSRIRFMPPIRVRWPWQAFSRHPLVAELNAALAGQGPLGSSLDRFGLGS